MTPPYPVRCAVHDDILTMVEDETGRPLWICRACESGDGLLYDLDR